MDDNNLEREEDDNDNELTYLPESIPSNVLSFMQHENNKELNEIIYYYSYYKTNIFKQTIKAKEPMNDISFQKSIYSSIENLLYQVMYIKSTPLRKSRITSVYLWLMNKIRFHNSVSVITTKTAMDTGQNFDEELKNDKPSEELTDEEKAKHRDHILSIGQFDEFKVRRIRLNTTTINNDDNNTQIAQSQINVSSINQHHYLPKSTFYSFFNFTKPKAKGKTKTCCNISSSIFNISQTNDTINPNKELKSSFPYWRPEKNYCMCNITKKIETEKNKELCEKRTKDSIQCAMDQFGYKRAEYKEKVLKKYEMKSILSQYLIPTSSATSFYKIKRNINDTIHKNESQTSLGNNNNNTDNSLLSSMKLNDLRDDKDIKGNLVKVRKSYKSLSNKVIRKKEIRGLLELKDLTCNIGKVLRNNIINVNKETNLIYSNKNEVKYSMIINKSQVSNKEVLVNELIKSELVPSSSVSSILPYNPIFKLRFMNKSMCNINEIDPYKDEQRSYMQMSLSSFDLLRFKREDKERFNTTEINKHKQIDSEYEFLKTSFFKNNKDYLTLRKSISNNKSNKVISLKKKLLNNQSAVNANDLSKAFINPNNEKKYPLHYLPKSGSGLLLVPTII